MVTMIKQISAHFEEPSCKFGGKNVFILFTTHNFERTLYCKMSIISLRQEATLTNALLVNRVRGLRFKYLRAALDNVFPRRIGCCGKKLKIIR